MNTAVRMRFLGAAFAVLCLALSLHAATPRILLVGDSWAGQESGYGSFNQAFAAVGLSEWSAKGNVTGMGGTTAAQWVAPAMLQRITDELVANPSITVVHISLGGNDFLGYVNGTRTRGQLDAFYQSTAANVAVVVNHALSQRPDIRVGISSYDYLMVPLFGMTSPQVNAELLIFGQVLRQYADATDRCTYINNWGLMQHHFGISGLYAPGELPAPGGPPDYVPFAGGDVNSIGVALSDPIHLTAAGYVVIAANCLEQAYLSWLGITQQSVLTMEALTDPANAQLLEYRITFNAPATGVDLSDFQLETTGAITAARIVSLSGSGDTYTAVIDRGFGSGTLTLSLVSDGSISGDMALKIPVGATFVGESYSIAEDRQVPVAAWPVALVLALAGTALASRQRR